MPIILGVDQAIGTPTCGFAVVEVSDLSPRFIKKVVETYVETYKGIKATEDRLRCLRFSETLLGLVLKYNISHIITEIVRGGQYNYAVVPLAMMQGVMNVAVSIHIPIYRAGTTSWHAKVLKPPERKKTDPKHDYKKLSVAHVLEQYGVTYPHHVCDAINLTEYLCLMDFQTKKNVLETV